MPTKRNAVNLASQPTAFDELLPARGANSKARLIAVIHLLPLPGSARWQGSMDRVIESACRDAESSESGGADAIVIENFGDIPFIKGPVAAETIAAMARVASEVHRVVKLPMGFNVLRNDPKAGLGLAAACGGSFIRVNVHSGAMLTDQGIIEGDAYGTTSLRSRIAPSVLIFADVLVKHAVPLGDWALEDAARDTYHRGLADALIVTGVGTGMPTDPRNVRKVREACPGAPILVGSGVTSASAKRFLPFVDGFIVGTSLKKDGRVENPIEAARVAQLRARLD